MVIDGNVNDWLNNTNYSTVPLYEAGKPDKSVLGAAYICTTGSQLNIWVTGADLARSPNDDWGTINGGPQKEYTGNSPSGTFDYVGTAGSYEARMTVALTCTVPITIAIHAEANTEGGHATAALGGGSPTAGVPMVEDCDNQLATATPTDTPTATDTPTPTDTATTDPEAPTATDTPTATATVVVTDTATPTATATVVVTDTATPTAIATATLIPTVPAGTDTPTPTPTATKPPTALTPASEPGRNFLPLVTK